MNAEFYGFEVQSNGHTVQWELYKPMIKEAVEKCRGTLQVFKHSGTEKNLIQKQVMKYRGAMKAAFVNALTKAPEQYRWMAKHAM